MVAGGGTGNTTFTAYALIAAGTTATGTFQNVVGLGTSGTLLQSAGAAALPAWTTATYPATATGTGTLLRADGTNWVATTSTYPNTNAVSTLLYASASNVMSALATGNDGVLITSHTGVPSILAGPGAAGKVLQSNTILPPSYSTPTYPSASGTSRTILVSDGTNNVYSTETWAVPGTSGNVLTSNGTNWTSAAPAASTWGGFTIVTLTGTLTNAQIKALHGTPVQLVAAPGSGKIVIPMNAYTKFIYGGSNVFVAGASQAINLAWGTVAIGSTMVTNAVLVGTTTQFAMANGTSVSTQLYSRFDNTALNWYNSVATEITGNAANDNTVNYVVTYFVLTL